MCEDKASIRIRDTRVVSLIYIYIYYVHIIDEYLIEKNIDGASGTGSTQTSGL